jgi:hypothetical protein
MNSVVDKENHNVFHYEFDVTFVKNLQKFLSSNLQTAIKELNLHLNNHSENDEDKKTDTNLINQLKDYLKLFQNLSNKFNNFMHAITGEHILSEQEVDFYNLLINYVNNKHKFNFYELINQLINNSFKILKILTEIPSRKIIDLNILFNTKKYLQEFIQQNYLLNIYERQPSTTAAMMIKNEHTFFKAMEFALPDFILEVNKRKVVWPGHGLNHKVDWLKLWRV